MAVMELVLVSRQTFWEAEVATPPTSRGRTWSEPDVRTLFEKDCSDCSTTAGDELSDASSQELQSLWSEAMALDEPSPPGVFFVPARVAKSRRGTRFVADTTPTVAAAPPAPPPVALEDRTTVVMRNLPRDLGRDALTSLVLAEDFGIHCDFVYLPFNFKKAETFGYAILNFTTACHAQLAIERFSAFELSSKSLMCDWSTSVQGMDVLMKKYRNSTVMHPAVPPACQPLRLAAGAPLAFPAATVELRPPASAELLAAIVT